MKKKTPSVDVMSHHIMPDMKVLEESEKKRVLKKYSINENQFPRIISSDPAAAALKAKAGDLIKIVRDDVTGKHTEYRIVTES